MFEKPRGHFKEARVKGRSMTEWASALKGTNNSLSTRLDVSRDTAFAEVDKLKLPRYKRFSVQLAEFLTNPNFYFNQIKSPYCYYNLKPLKKGLKVYRDPGVTKEQVLDFASILAGKGFAQDYQLTVSEYYENEFGGNIIINPNGELFIEFKKGSQGPISHGNKVPQYTVKNDRFTKTLKYSFENQELRRMIKTTLDKIPKDEENNYLPGYYEFQLVKKSDDGLLEPIFIDFKDDKAYFLEK